MTAAPAGASLAVVLLAAAVVVGVAQLGGLVAVRWRQPAVVGELVAVIAAGPGVLGALAPAVTDLLFPPAVLDVFRLLGGVGVALFVFAVGVGMPSGLLRGAGRTATVIGTSAFVLPAAVGVGIGVVLAAVAPRIGTDGPAEILFLGLAMGMTAFPVLARILDDVAGLDDRMRVLGLSLAGIADAFGWGGLVLLLAGDVRTGALRLGAALLGVAAVVLVGRALLHALARWSRRREVPALATGGVVLATVLASAALSELGGLHSVVGALVAGVALPRTAQVLALAAVLETVSGVLLLPMFFLGVSAGVRLGGPADPVVLVLLVVVPVLGVAVKLLAAWAPARALGMSQREGLALGAMAGCRGLTEIVVLMVGLAAGLIPAPLFTVFVVMSLVGTAVTGPALRWLVTDAPAAVDPPRPGGGTRTVPARPG